MADPTTATAPPDAADAGPDASADRNNHEQRIRAGGDWAVEYTKKLESRADKAEREAREAAGKTGALDRYFRAGLSDKDIAGHLGTLQKALTDPKFGPVLQSYIATGKLEVPKGSSVRQDDDDEYLSDELREIRALKAEIAEVRGLARESHLGLGTQAVTTNLERVARDLGLDAETLSSVKASAVEIVRGWQSQGESGERALRSLQHPEHGLKTARTLVLEALGDEGLEKVYRNKFLRESSTRRGMATDSPSPHRAGTSKAMPQFDSMLDAIQAVDARPELLEEHGY